MANRHDSALGCGAMDLARLVDKDKTGIVDEQSRFELVPARA